MTITTKFLKDLRESADAELSDHLKKSMKAKADDKLAENDGYDENEMEESLEADVPTHPSDASDEIPDHLKEEDDEDEKDSELTEEEDSEEDDELTEEDEEDEMAEENEDEDSELTEEEDSEEDELAEEDEGDEDEMKENLEADVPTHPSAAASQIPDHLKEEDEEDSEDEEESDEEDELTEEDSELTSDEKEKMKKEEEDEVKEAADALTKDEKLSESFKKKVNTIFEAAIKRTVSKRAENQKRRLIENYNKKLKLAKKAASNKLVNKVDDYLNYVVEEWVKQNKVAIEGSLRSEITEKFISGLKNLFENHYIEVPAKKKNILAEQELRIKKLEKTLNEQFKNTVALKKQNALLRKTMVIKKMSEDMTANDAAKFSELCEGVAFQDTKTFAQKLRVIKESYFSKKSSQNRRDIDSSLLIEGGLKHEEKNPSEVDIFADTISRMCKK